MFQFQLDSELIQSDQVHLPMFTVCLGYTNFNIAREIPLALFVSRMYLFYWLRNVNDYITITKQLYNANS